MAQVVSSTTRRLVRRILRGRPRRSVAALATVVLTAALVPLMTSTPAQAAPAGRSTIFTATGAEQTYTVPADATSLRVRLVGAPGGKGGLGHCARGTCPTTAGGRGQLVDGTIAVCADGCAVTPGQTLYVEVGGIGTNGSFDEQFGQSAGGFNGGGPSLTTTGGGGGGASDLRTVAGTSGLNARILVAGGGGGAGSNGNQCGAQGFYVLGGTAGDAGNPAGGTGGKGTDNLCSGGGGGGNGGGGAGQNAGGTAGAPTGAAGGCNGAISGTAGAFGQGGSGNWESNWTGGRSRATGGGGGGGGWYGGGGGAGGAVCGLNTTMSAGGGGGGSSYTGTATATAFATDTTGVPQVQILTSTSEAVTSVDCSPTPALIGAVSVCSATVLDVVGDAVTPTGTITFSSTNPGTFSATTCTLVGGSCSVNFTPTAASGSSTRITAAHPGDFAHPAASSASVDLAVNLRSTGVSSSCTAGAAGRASTCTAIVTDTDTGSVSTPTGTITWSGSGGTFGATSCTLSAGRCSVTFTPAAVGNAALTSVYNGDGSHVAGFTSTILVVGQGTGSATVANLPSSGVYGGSFTATYTKVGDGTVSLSTSTSTICSVTGNLVSYSAPGVCRLTASTSATTDYAAGSGAVQNFTIAKAANTVSIANLPTAAVFGGTFTPTYSRLGSGAASSTSQTPTICSITGGVVSFAAVGSCRLQAAVATDANYLAATGAVQSFTIGQATGSIIIADLPAGGTVGTSFTPQYTQVGSGAAAVVSSTPSVCTVTDGVVQYLTAGNCSLQARAAATTNHTAATGPVQTVPVDPGTAAISVAKLPATAVFGGSFTVQYTQVGNGTPSVSTLSPAICSVGDGPAGASTVRYLGAGTCRLQTAVSATDDWNAATGPVQTFTVDQAVGSISIVDLPTAPVFGDRFTPEYQLLGDGTPSVTSLTAATCVVENGVVRFVGAGICRVRSAVGAGTNHLAATGAVETLDVGQAAGSVSIGDLPSAGSVGTDFTPTFTRLGSGTASVSSLTPTVCTVDAGTVSYAHVGNCELQAAAGADADHLAAIGPVQSIPVAQGTASVSISNLPSEAVYLGTVRAQFSQVGDGTPALTSSTPTVCTVGDGAASTLVTYIGAGTCRLQATLSATDDWTAATGPVQTFTVDRAVGLVAITNLPTEVVFGDLFSPQYLRLGDGDPSITSLTAATCAVENGVVEFTAAGTCRVRADVTVGTNHLAAQGAVESIEVGQAAGSISISDLPTAGSVGTGFAAAYLQVGSGEASTSSLTPGVCSVDGNAVAYQHVGTCTLQAASVADPDHTAATGPAQSIDVGQGTASVRIANLPSNAVFGGDFVPQYSLAGDGPTSTDTLTPEVCTTSEDVSGTRTVSFRQGGSCVLQASVAASTDWAAATGPEQTFVIDPAAGSIEISNLPTAAVFGGSFTPAYLQVGTGTPAIASLTPQSCSVDGVTVSYTDTGVCTLQASAAATVNHTAATGARQSVTVGRAPGAVRISGLPSPGIVGTDLTPTYSRTGDGTPSTDSLTPETCSVAAGTVRFLAAGSCELRASTAETDHFAASTGTVQIVTVVGAPIITDDPQDASVTARQSVTFTAAATGQDPVTVQWQVIVGSTWLDLPGRTGTALSFTTAAAQDGNRYRAVFTDIGGSTATAPATLSVARIPLKVVATTVSFQYGSPAPAISPFYDGLVDGDTEATVVLQAPRCSTPADADSFVGGYPTDCTGGVFQDDYVISYASGTASVHEAPLLLSGRDQAFRYGDPRPELGYTVTGFVRDDTAAVVAGAPVLTTEATSTSSPGRYRVGVRQGTLRAANYYFVEVDGSLTVTPAAGALQAIRAARVLDTRSGQGAAKAPVGPKSSVVVQITGRGGVPATGVSSVVASVTAVSSTAPGTLVAYPASAVRPGTASLNFAPGRAVTNLVVVPVDATGKIRLYNGSAGTVQILVDVSGYYVSGTPTVPGTYRSVAGARVLDTRSNLGGAKGLVQPQSSVAVRVTGRAGVPTTGVSSVLVNVTVVSPTTRGFLAVYPASSARPATSMLNFTSGESISGLVLVPVDAQGRIRLFNGSGGTAHIVVDIAGWNLAGARIAPGGTATVPSRRLLDTRTGLGGPKEPVAPSQSIYVQVQGRAGIPTNDAGPGASAVLAVVTVVSPSVSGYLTAFSPSIEQPRTASLNFTPGRSVSALVLVPLRADQGIRLYNGAGSGTGVDVLVDVVGYVPR